MTRRQNTCWVLWFHFLRTGAMLVALQTFALSSSFLRRCRPSGGTFRRRGTETHSGRVATETLQSSSTVRQGWGGQGSPFSGTTPICPICSSIDQTSARVRLLRVEIENETSQRNFWELRMRVLEEKWRVENENESSEGKESWYVVWDSWIF